MSGTVRTDQGTPIAAAQVCATCASCAITELPLTGCVQTDHAGAYALPYNDARPLLISAVAPGFAMGEANSGLPLKTEGRSLHAVDIVLERGGAKVAGLVLDALGGPVAGARVQAVRFKHGLHPLVEVPTDASGRFEIWTSPGPATIRAEAEGYAPATVFRVAPSAGFEIRLTPASTLQGRVVVAGTGAPAAGVEVRAVPAQATPRAPAALSDAQGQFELRALEPGRYVLSAESEQYRGASSRPIEVGLADSVKSITVEVMPAVSVIGHVSIAKTQKPCQRGLVSLGAPTEGSSALAKTALSEADLAVDPDALPSVTSTIDADGTARFKGVTPGRYYASVQCPGFVLDEGPELLSVGNEPLEVSWRVTRGLTLTVHVVDEADQPVPGASLNLWFLRNNLRNSSLAMQIATDSRGVAQMSSDLYPGAYRVEASGGLEGDPLTVELREGTSDVTLRVKGSGSIVVDARDKAGQAVGGLQVTARGEGAPEHGPNAGVSARELGDGRYRIGPLRAGRYAVHAQDGVNPPVEPEGTRGGLIEVLAGSSAQARVVIDNGASLRGRVVDETGQPETDVWVSAEQASEENDPFRSLRFLTTTPPRVMTDPLGEFVLTGLKSGAHYSLRARQPFGAAARLREVTPEQGAVTIVLPHAGSISGTVRDATGKPAPGSSVQARHGESDTLRRSPTTGSDGRFGIEGIPAGAVVLTALTPTHGATQLNIELRGGQKLEDVQLTLTPSTDDTNSGQLIR